MGDVCTALVKFEGDEIEVIRSGETLWVSVRRVCEALGLAPNGQVEKLKTKPWAVGKLILSTGADGKNYETFCISHRSLPMWLATIEPSRASPHIREKLTHYQLKCADVLAKTFFGETQDYGAQLAVVVKAQADLARVHAEQIGLVMEALQATRADLTALASQVATLAVMVRQSPHGTISGFQADWIAGQIEALAHMRIALGKHKSLRSARGHVQSLVNAAAQWGGRGLRRCNMPADRFALVKTCLETHKHDLLLELKKQRAAAKALATAGHQTKLWDRN